MREITEDLHVAGAPQPRFVVEYTQGSDRVVLAVDQRYAEIGDNGPVEHRGVIPENRIRAGILEKQRRAVCHRVLTNGAIEGVWRSSSDVPIPTALLKNCRSTSIRDMAADGRPRRQRPLG